jgi:hypothetical protein
VHNCADWLVLVLQELMRQASWNLCPQDIQYNTACYADRDKTFNAIAGSTSSPMPDLPDGDWALVLKKDIFQKVLAWAAVTSEQACARAWMLTQGLLSGTYYVLRMCTMHLCTVRTCSWQAVHATECHTVACSVQTRGAVRDSTKLAKAAFWYKVYIAAAAATAEQAFEVSLLNSALRLLDVSLLDALPAVWAASGQGSRDAFDAAHMRNATCLCGAAVESLLTGTPYYVNTTYAANNCTGRVLLIAVAARC